MGKKPPLTLVLIGISVLVFLAIFVFKLNALILPLLISTKLDGLLPEVMAGQYWRLVTPMFLHFGLFHIVFNSLWLWELGRIIEYKQGSLILGVLVLITSTCANLLQYFFSNSVFFGGMSGVVYGLFGYVWMQGLFNPNFGIRLNPAIVNFMLIFFAICWTGVLELLFGVHVANMAHSGGLIAGVVFGILGSLIRKRS